MAVEAGCASTSSNGSIMLLSDKNPASEERSAMSTSTTYVSSPVPSNVHPSARGARYGLFWYLRKKICQLVNDYETQHLYTAIDG